MFCYICYFCDSDRVFVAIYEGGSESSVTGVITLLIDMIGDFTPGVFQGAYFAVFMSFVHYFGIIIKEKCSPFN